jgi:hypothetical protein
LSFLNIPSQGSFLGIHAIKKKGLGIILGDTQKIAKMKKMMPILSSGGYLNSPRWLHI